MLLQSKESFMRDLSTSRPLSSAEDVDKAITESREKVNHLWKQEIFSLHFCLENLKSSAAFETMYFFFIVPYSVPDLRGKFSVNPVSPPSAQTRG